MTEPVDDPVSYARELIAFRKAVKGATPILHYGVETTPEQAAQDRADYEAKQVGDVTANFHPLVEERAQAIAAETAPQQQEGPPE